MNKETSVLKAKYFPLWRLLRTEQKEWVQNRPPKKGRYIINQSKWTDLRFEFGYIGNKSCFISTFNRVLIKSSFTESLPYDFICQRGFRNPTQTRNRGRIHRSQSQSPWPRTRHSWFHHTTDKFTKTKSTFFLEKLINFLSFLELIIPSQEQWRYAMLMVDSTQNFLCFLLCLSLSLHSLLCFIGSDFFSFYM